MGAPFIPSAIGPLANRPFSFYPPLRGIGHNQWHFRKATWSELVVVHARTAEEISIPRRFVGEISAADDPVVIVSLLRELEYRQGAVTPFGRRVIEMPVAAGETVARPLHRGPAPVVGIRLESRRRSRIVKIVGGGLALAMVLHVAVAALGKPVTDGTFPYFLRRVKTPQSPNKTSSGGVLSPIFPAATK